MGRRGNVKKKNVKAGDYTENFHINSQKKNITQIGHSQKKKKHHTSALRKEKTPFALDTDRQRSAAPFASCRAGEDQNHKAQSCILACLQIVFVDEETNAQRRTEPRFSLIARK